MFWGMWFQSRSKSAERPFEAMRHSTAVSLRLLSRDGTPQEPYRWGGSS